MSDTSYNPPPGLDLPPIPVDHGYTIRDFKDKYREGVDYLDYNYAFFLTHVLNIGPPEWVNNIPTAAVGFDPNAGEKPEDFRFLFNGDFAMQLSPEHMGFVEAHETMHILLDHLKLYQKQKDKKFANSIAFNVAADCVINDYLSSRGLDIPEWVCRGEKLVGYDCTNATVTQVYSDLEQKIQDAKDQQGQCPACGGSGQVPEDQEGQGSEQSEQGEQGDGQGGAGDSGEEQGDDGQGSEGDGDQGDQQGQGAGGHSHDPNATKPCPHCHGTGQGGLDFSGQFDSHEWMKDPKLAKAIDKLREQAQKGGQVPKDILDKAAEDKGEKDKSRGLMPGMGITDAESFSEVKGVSFKWVELLKQINPDVIKSKKGPPPRPSYHTPRRKLMGIRDQNPDLNLPVFKKRGRDKGEIPSIVMALDTSGSIGNEDANRFVNLAKSIPTDKIHLFACTFTSQYMPLDLEKPKWVSGGTHFGAIEQFIQKEVVPSEEFKKTRNKTGYPNAVVVVTDGYATFGTQGGVDKPLPENYPKWFWLIMNFDAFKSGQGYGSSYWNNIKGIGRHESLGKFTAGTMMAKEMEQYA